MNRDQPGSSANSIVVMLSDLTHADVDLILAQRVAELDRAHPGAGCRLRQIDDTLRKHAEPGTRLWCIASIVRHADPAVLASDYDGPIEAIAFYILAIKIAVYTSFEEAKPWFQRARAAGETVTTRQDEFSKLYAHGVQGVAIVSPSDIEIFVDEYLPSAGKAIAATGRP